MSIVIFIPIGEEHMDLTGGGMEGGIVNKIGNDKTEELNVQKDNHQRTFLVRNDDDSLEVFNLVKRTTADLVLPDNRMSLVTFVDYHKHFDTISLDTLDLKIIIENGLNLKDSIINTKKTVESLHKATEYQYKIFNKNYEPIIIENNKIERQNTNSSIGKTLLSKVKQQNKDIKDIEQGYVTIIKSSKITKEWIKNAVQTRINITDEEEVSLDIMSMTTVKSSNEESAKEPIKEDKEESDRELVKELAGESDVKEVIL